MVYGASLRARPVLLYGYPYTIGPPGVGRERAVPRRSAPCADRIAPMCTLSQNGGNFSDTSGRSTVRTYGTALFHTSTHTRREVCSICSGLQDTRVQHVLATGVPVYKQLCFLFLMDLSPLSSYMLRSEACFGLGELLKNSESNPGLIGVCASV